MWITREIKGKCRPSLWSQSTWPGANIMSHNHTTRPGDPAIPEAHFPRASRPEWVFDGRWSSASSMLTPTPSQCSLQQPCWSWTGVSVGVWGAQAAPCYLRARGVFIRFKQQLAPQGSSCSYLIRDALLSHMKLHAVIRQAACTAAKQREAGSW